MADLVDIDQPSTWPSDLRQLAEELAIGPRRRHETAGDLQFGDSVELHFAEMLGGHRLRAYHATRLFDHEVAAIRERGLLALSRELVDNRIDDAFERRVITREERDQFLEAHIFAPASAWMPLVVSAREGSLWFVLSRDNFRGTAEPVQDLLRLWGGEGIYNNREMHRHEKRLAQLGRPAIVVAALDLGDSIHEVSLAHTFVGRLIQRSRLWVDVSRKGSVPPNDILDIWQPGHAEYDRYRRLPRR